MHILAGAPKIGKSWLALWLCLCVAQGQALWNFATTQGEALYLSLEDSFQRIQTRLFDLTEDAPPTLHFAIMADTLKHGLEQQIEQFLTDHPATKLVVIDTLQRVRSTGGDSNLYANDYHQQLDRFFASLQGGSPGQIDAELEALLSACEKGSVRTVRSVGVLMLVRCLRILREINPEYSQIFIDSAIQDRIYEFKSMWEFRRLAQDMTMQMRTILSDRQNQTDWLITEVNDFIAQNYCGHVTLAEIADSVHVNRSYLSRIYKERTGKNVFDVINARRVEKAKELLQTTNMRVYEVALFVGFEDAAYFSRFFKRYTGVSPKKFEYRGGNL